MRKIKQLNIDFTNELVLIRLETKYGYSNTWWRVMFIHNNDTFIGRLEICNKREFTEYTIGQDIKFPIDVIQHIYQIGEQFCYSDNVTICGCSGLCRNK